MENIKEIMEKHDSIIREQLLNGIIDATKDIIAHKDDYSKGCVEEDEHFYKINLSLENYKHLTAIIIGKFTSSMSVCKWDVPHYPILPNTMACDCELTLTILSAIFEQLAVDYIGLDCD